MACNRCLNEYDKQYLKELSKLSLVQRLSDKGKRLVARYGERISTPCQHEVSNG